MSQPSASRQLVRRDLALAERAVREVPQRPLTAPRLVDRGQLHAVDLRLARGTSRSTSSASGRRPRARRASSASRELVGGQFQRGHRCPAGSIGCSHSGHGGRPPATASAPRAAIARTCGARRVDARDVALVVVVGRRLASAPRRRPRRRRARAARSARARARGRSRGRSCRARNSGTVGSRSWRRSGAAGRSNGSSG